MTGRELIAELLKTDLDKQVKIEVYGAGLDVRSVGTDEIIGYGTAIIVKPYLTYTDPSTKLMTSLGEKMELLTNPIKGV